MKIAFFEIEDWEKKYLEEKLKGFELEFFEDEVKPTDADIISTFIYSKIDKRIISSCSNLKYITTRSTGFDHIDLKYSKEKGIILSNVPVYGENTVAEHTFALILNISRKICQSQRRTKNGDFSVEGLEGFDLKGKTIGIIGLGSIGSQVYKIAKGFGMKVLTNDLIKCKNREHTDFDTLISSSDIVTLHVPYDKSTHHLINKNNLSLFKKGAVLINTSRGGLCETEALLRGLENNTFSYLGLDVLEEESFIREERELLSKSFKKTCDLKTALQNHILLRHRRVSITPHNAFNSREALERILETTIQNIKSFDKKKPINTI